MQRLEHRLPAAGLDIDNSGIVDIADVDMMCFEVLNHQNIPTDHHAGEPFDLNGDDVINGADLDHLLAEGFNTIRGDANLDGRIDHDDIGNSEPWRAISGVINDVVHGTVPYSGGNFTCDNYRPGRDDGDMFAEKLNSGRALAADYILANRGDIDGDGRFNSEDLVQLFTLGLYPATVDSDVIVQLFINGNYEAP